MKTKKTSAVLLAVLMVINQPLHASGTGSDLDGLIPDIADNPINPGNGAGAPRADGVGRGGTVVPCDQRDPRCVQPTNPVDDRNRPLRPLRPVIVTPPPSDGNGRPTIVTAQVPDEYACPLFNNRPYETLYQAIDALELSVTTSPECQKDEKSMLAVQTNTEQVRSSVKAIQDFVVQPANAYGNIATLEDNMKKALTGISNLGNIFQADSMMTGACGKQVIDGGSAFLKINEIVNNFAPFALLAASLHPGISAATKIAITAGAVGTSSISSMAKLIENDSIDMSIPEHRKAVLQNTCQFTKVARKIRYIQLAQTGQTQQLMNDLNKTTNNYQLMINQTSMQLKSLLTYKQGVLRVTETVEDRLRKDRVEMDAVHSQINESNNDNLMVCLIAQELTRTATRLDTFPGTVIDNLEYAQEVSNGDLGIKLQTLKALQETTIRRLSVLMPKVTSDDENAIKSCAEAGRSWIAGLDHALLLTSNLVTTGLTELEAELGQDPEYSKFQTDSAQADGTKANIDRLAKVLKELSKDVAVFDRSELSQRMEGLKASLLGNRGVFSWGVSPVESWMTHTKGAFESSRSSFIQNVQKLITEAYYSTPYYRTQYWNKVGGQGTQADLRARSEAYAQSKALSSLDKNALPVGSRGHELACQALETAWLDWSAAYDHMGSISFMCDMIDPYIDNKIDTNIVNICRGDQLFAFANSTTSNSLVNTMKTSMDNKLELLGTMTLKDYAKVISNKITALQCGGASTRQEHN